MKTSEAIALVGSRAKLAKLLGIRRQAVYQWGENMPELRVYQLRDRIATQYPSSLPPLAATAPPLPPPGD